MDKRDNIIDTEMMHKLIDGMHELQFEKDVVYKLSEEEKDRMIAFAEQADEGERMKGLLNGGYPNSTTKKESIATPMHERASVNKLFAEMHQSMLEDDNARKEREADCEKFFNEPNDKWHEGVEVKGSEYEGITSRVKDQQRALNMSFFDFVDEFGFNKKFNDWFDSYSFAYVPSFAKPLIKQWVKAAYLAALGEVK